MPYPPNVENPHCILYYWDSGNFIFILTDTKIIMYDLDKQIMVKIYQYPLDPIIDTRDIYGCVDSHRKLIYVVFSTQNVFAFSIIKNRWIKLNETNLNPSSSLFSPSLFSPNVAFIPSPFNRTIAVYHEKGKFVYNSKKKQLMEFQPEEMNMYQFCDISEQFQGGYNWKKSGIKLY